MKVRVENLDKTFAASLRRLPKLLILLAQKLMHYSDSKGLEADAVVQLSDGRYALIEIKTETNAIPSAEKNLLKFVDVIRKHNEKVSKNESHPKVRYREPSLLLIICGNATMAYTTENGVKVIPVGCLKD